MPARSYSGARHAHCLDVNARRSRYAVIGDGGHWFRLILGTSRGLIIRESLV